MANVEIRNVYKSYGTVEVLHGVDVPIEDGEFVVLVGPSGCGKSTLLQMIAGLEDITGGEIQIGDRVVNHLPPKERDIAMVFQNYALYPHMNVAENMSFSMRIRGASAEEIKIAVQKSAQILGLEELLHRYPRELSGGQRQRVAMGRAIVRQPQVFLFDEPLSNLDAKLRGSMRTEIKDLHQRLKTTTIFVTHDQIEAMTMADKIVVMNAGVIEQIGAPLELYDEPGNLFVASFIGSPSINLLKGNISNGKFKAENDSVWELPESGKKLRDGYSCIYGVRPEHLHIGKKGNEVSIRVVEPSGSETQVVTEIADEKIVCLFRERMNKQSGDTISIYSDAAKCHLFDIDSGARIS